MDQHRHNARVIELLTTIHEHQHTILERIATVSESTKDMLARQTAAIDNLETAVTAEVGQLRDAIANMGNLSADDRAQLEKNIGRIEAAVGALKADDAPVA